MESVWNVRGMVGMSTSSGWKVIGFKIFETLDNYYILLTNSFLIRNYINFGQHMCGDKRLINFNKCLIATSTDPGSFLAKTGTQATVIKNKNLLIISRTIKF